MFLSLLLITFAVSAVACFILARIFRQPVDSILARIIADPISVAWRKYIGFAIYVVGISGGVRVWDLEKYIMPRHTPEGLAGKGVAAVPLALNAERWILEIYRTLISTLQSVAWMLLVFFAFALIAYVVVRIAEMKRPPRENNDR